MGSVFASFLRGASPSVPPTSPPQDATKLPAAPKVQSAALLGISDAQWRALEEQPACCSGSRKQLCVDIDETVHGGKKVADLWRQTGSAAMAVPAPQTAPTPIAPIPTADGQAPASAWAWTRRLPQSHMPWPMTALTLWTAVPGLLFSWQNYAQAKKVTGLLQTLDQALVARTKDLQTTPAVGTHDAEQNIEAYRATIAHSLSMQRFIRYFAGALAGASSLLVIGTLFVPALEPIALCTLMAYCASFAIRYTRWDRPKLQTESASVKQPGKLAALGRQMTEQTRTSRSRLFLGTGACFALYGVGAGLLAVSAAAQSAVLLAAGMASLFVGMSSVTYLNNFPIKETFGKNRDRHVNREALGSMDDIYRDIGLREKQCRLLREFDQALDAIDRSKRTWGDTYWATVEAVTIGATLATLGLWPGPLHAVQHRVRERQLKRMQNDARVTHEVKTLGHRFKALEYLAAHEAGTAYDADTDKKEHASLGAALSRVNALLPEGLLEYAGHTHLEDDGPSPHHACEGGHDHPDEHHDHAHAPHIDWQREDAQLAGLHALRFGLKGEKEFQIGALIDHALARSRLRAAAA